MKLETLKKLVIDAAEDVKAKDITELDVSELTDMTDVMLIITGTSSRHLKAVASNIVEKVKKGGLQPVGVEGENTGEWVLVDLGDIIIHIMLPEMRDFYDLERLWSARPAERLSTDGE